MPMKAQCTSSKRRKIVSLMPYTMYDYGHYMAYNLALKAAVESRGWEFSAAVPRSCTIQPLPSGFQPILSDRYFTDEQGRVIWQSKWAKLCSLFKNIPPYCRLLRTLSKESVVVMESFYFAEFVALFLAILWTRPSATFCFVHRYLPYQMPFKGHLYKWLYKLVPGRFVTMTDSEIIQKELQTFFQRPVQLLPIPHTENSARNAPSARDEFLWWPGADPRLGKGLDVIQRVVEQNSGKLVVSRLAKSYIFSEKTKMDLEFVPPYLSREEYWSLLKKARFVLLPHDPGVYAGSTSGIFVEAIVSGARPLVRDGTWMAHELQRFGLAELISDFQLGFDKIEVNEEKLAVMRKAYEEFHSVESYAHALELGLQ